jgi:putative phosphoesterase
VTPVRVAVLSDTHLRPGGKGLPAAVHPLLESADAILHAGDVVSGFLLDELATLAPTHVVLGNNDHDLRGQLPERLEVELGGVIVAMVHDSGPRAGRSGRLRRWFPAADIVVFGHSHEPVDEVGVDGQRLFNPGSPTQRRRQPHPTMGLLELAGGRVLRHEIVRVEP